MLLDLLELSKAEELMVEELKRLKVTSSSKLLHEDLLKKLYSRGPYPRGLTFSKEELEGLANVNPSKEKNKKDNKRKRVIRSLSPKDVATEAIIAEADITKVVIAEAAIAKTIIVEVAK
ncbi:hypothetical protein COCNU_scaffold003960G000010 [Cocos nucifera]|nr:hypothetical protein [Cocos nucifera]